MTAEPFTSFNFIGSGDEYFDRIVAEINTAQTEILMECYIFDFDEVGQRVLRALATAAKRKVLTRLMVDGIGTYTQISQIKSYCRSHGIHFRVYRPLPKFLVRFTRFTQFMRTANRRNHRKILIVDKTKAIVASFNISRVHSEKLVGAKVWRDLAAYVEGPEVVKIWDLASAYWTKFRLSLRRRIPKIHFTRVRSTHSMWARRTSRNLLFEKIKNSKKNIKILTPYFIPSKKLVRSLRRACNNHQNIEIIIPVRSDFLIVDMAARHIIRTMLHKPQTREIRFYQYTPTFLHAKSVQSDDWATMGSHNLNHRSLVHDLELDITLEAQTELEALNSYWQYIKSESRLMTREDLAKDSFFTRLLCRFSFWFKNWL